MYELIDTLWNVNLFAIMINFSNPGINRYIMECKCCLQLFTIPTHFELIDTLWNVNALACLEGYSQPYELIDTLWNVN